MSRTFLIILISFCIACSSYAQNLKQQFVYTDIDNFWNAYDKIVSTKDSVQQHTYLQQLYIEKGTAGLRSLMQVRRYTNQQFIDAINRFPLFWQSLRASLKNIPGIYPGIEKNIQQLKQIYPNLKPSTIYFTIGAFRSNGTTQGFNVLIGAELALADSFTVIKELPEWQQSFYRDFKPKENIALLCTHEYIHTQQKPFVENLLSMCLYEGVAEFLSCKASGSKSNTPAIAFGKANHERVIRQFVADLFLMSNISNWLWGQNSNALKISDLGYYVGYEMCERYYNAATDKVKAIKELVELDYEDEKEIERIVDATHLLPQRLVKLYAVYEKERPTVVAVQPFKNGSKNVKPGKTSITVLFSEPLNGHNTGVDFGPLGEKHFPKTAPVKTWSADNKSWTLEVNLEANQQYQILISNNFRKENGVRLKPFLIEFNTTE